LAKSGKEIEQIWAIRDEVEPVIDGALNFDVSLKSADVGDYVAKVDAAIHERFADANVVGFGHLGDNNVHISVSMADRASRQVHDVEEIVYGCLAAYDGAVSAEHGIGLTKREWLPVSRTPAEIDLMLKLKSTLDPKNILNPGKVVSA
jgi:FAD/FMN-containing dehydrogenase